MTTNADEIAYWNADAAERWVRARERIDRAIGRISDALFDFAAPRPGERVLDVGCGCGTTTLELVRRGAKVMGVDVSRPMVAVAQARVPQGEFVVGDASCHEFAERFDLVFSRFGVMFFADPVAAFAHLREIGGRLAFACWRALDVNPWASVALAAGAGLIAPRAKDPHAPGGFAFADGERVRGILARAGWRDIEVAPHDTTVWLGETADAAADYALTVGPLAGPAAELADDVRGTLRARLVEAFARHASAEGVTPPGAVWLVRAR